MIMKNLLNAIKEYLKIMKLGKICRMVKNDHTGLNHMLKEVYYREESESALSNGHQYTVL